MSSYLGINEPEDLKPTFTEDDIKFFRSWSEALRSGNYKQARDHLTDGENFCCLGVAGCLIAGYDPSMGRQSLHSVRYPSHAAGDPNVEGLEKLFPDEVMQAAKHYEQAPFIFLNDKLRLSFHQIADFVDYLTDNLTEVTLEQEIVE